MTTRISPRVLAIFALVIVAAALVLAPGSARAAVAASNYRLDSLRYASGTPVGTCRGWGADADDAGNFYAACPVMRDLDGNGTGDVQAPALYEMDPSGKVLRIGWLPAEYAFDYRYPIRDVGVSPDGKAAYVSVGPNVDYLGTNPNLDPSTGQPLANGATAGSILRLVRQPDGSWAHDPTFKAGPFNIGGSYWAIRYVDVDASGRIYVTVNSYVYELSPTTGQVVSAFGDAITAYPGGPWVEGIDTPEGIAVSADGATVWVVDQQHQVVQRWRRVGATDWTRDTSFLLGRPDEVGDYCGTNDHFQSPYDVALDAAGDVYVMDTTCQRIQRFTSAGQFVQTVWSNAGGEDMNHGFAVNWQGSIVLPIEEDVLVRLDPPSRPAAGNGRANGGGGACTDKAAPKLTGVRTATLRPTTRTVRLEAVASDDCGVVQVAVTGQRTGRARWLDGTTADVALSGWNGRKQLVVHVRDAKGRTAVRRVTLTLALPQPTLRARTRIRIAGSGCSTVAPARRIGRRYVLRDRCARITGRVVAARSTRMFQVLVSAAQARALYANAVGPVRVWVVADARTSTAGRLRVGRPVSIVASIVAERSGSAAYAMPADRVVAR